MKIPTRHGMAGTRVTAMLGVAALAGAAALAFAGPADAATVPHDFLGGARPVVLVQTDNTAGNQVVVYDRAGDGTLSQAGAYATGGLGGQTAGSAADHLSSQGSLAPLASRAAGRSISQTGHDGDDQRVPLIC